MTASSSTPLRFGRNDELMAMTASSSTPLRFGRNDELVVMTWTQDAHG